MSAAASRRREDSCPPFTEDSRVRAQFSTAAKVVGSVAAGAFALAIAWGSLHWRLDIVEKEQLSEDARTTALEKAYQNQEKLMIRVDDSLTDIGRQLKRIDRSDYAELKTHHSQP